MKKVFFDKQYFVLTAVPILVRIVFSIMQFSLQTHGGGHSTVT